MRRLSLAAFVLVGMGAAVALVLVLAPNANPNPDGLEKVAAAKGIEPGDRALADGPLADYGVRGVHNRYVGTWIAGLVGVAVTFAVGTGVVLVVRRGREPAPARAGPPGRHDAMAE